MKLIDIDKTLKYVLNKDGSYTFIFIDTISNMLNKEVSKEKLNFYFLNNN
jgi:hypothetical protein